MRLPVPFWSVGDVNVSNLAKVISNIDEKKWIEWNLRQTKFDVHKKTNSIPFIWNKWDPQYRLLDLEYMNQDTQLWELLKPFLRKLINKYDGSVVNCLFARLPSGAEIKPHKDISLNLLLVHRIHLAVITSSAVKFFIDNTPYEFPAGRIFELSNDRLHAVKNNGDDHRVHLIVDILPNYFRSFLKMKNNNLN
tara:strand:- start:3095 stop:3673 length:579 start_codon:yes stop_codon:yes gene_type:complete